MAEQPEVSGSPIESPPQRAFRFAYGLTAALLVLEVAGRLSGIRAELLPVPSRIVLEIWRNGTTLASQTWVTASELLGGMLIALLLSAPVAALSALSPGFRAYAVLVFRALCAMPLPAVAPVSLVWFGYGRTPKILVAALLGTVWVARRWLEGFERLAGYRRDLIQSMGGSSRQLFIYAQLPASAGALMSGLRAGTSNALIGVVIGELVAGDTGLGPVVVSAMFKFNTPQLAAALTLLLALGLLLQITLKSIETAVARRVGMSD
jgi:NitT/TauT family transport system permease protein